MLGLITRSVPIGSFGPDCIAALGPDIRLVGKLEQVVGSQDRRAPCYPAVFSEDKGR